MPSTAQHNHLVVGLGGTGGNIIRALRKLVFQNFRQDDPTNVNLRYLYVDTSAELMRADDPTWKLLGHSVQISERSQMLITGMNFRNVVDNLSNYPGISPWLGNRGDFAEILASADAAQVVGAQKRRLGRFLFACQAAKFRDLVKDFVREMTHDGADGQRSNQTTFHVCCGLAGGTGSGCVVDAISQIRANFPDAKDRIILYALLPERHPPGSKAGPNYHANGYSALMELNALVVGTWKPHDVAGTGHVARLNLQDPFNCCYLFNDENEANISVDVQAELPEIVASFLYQKIVEAQHIEWGISNTLLRQETYEVGPQAKSPECSPKGRPRRSRSFFSFGIKQIAYPEAEIWEYLTYSFARQAVLQLMFNKWVEGQGYKEEAVNQPFAEYVQDKATLEKWYLTDERLTLSEGILKAEINNRKWRTISDFWKTKIPAYLSMVLDRAGSDTVKMLSEFTRLCDEVYREQYRDEGVAKFYETKRRGDLRDHAREIRGKIESDLFGEWKNGARSLHDTSRLLAAMLNVVEERINGMDDKIAKLSEESERYRENEIHISNNRNEWAKMGTLSVLVLGKHKKLLSAQAECFITRYTMRTRVEGFRYAKDLLVVVRQELNGLASEISRCAALVFKAAKAFQVAIDARCSDKAKLDLSKQVVRFYDPGAVKSFTREMTTDLAEQRKQTSKVRARLAEMMGEKQSFSSFNNRITEGVFSDILESTCEESAVEAHQEFIARNPDRGRILQVSLIELMRREFDRSDDQMRKYVQNVIEMSQNYLKLEDSQRNIVGPGIPAANDSANAVCVSNLTIIAPEAPDAREFREKFCRTVRDATKAEAQVVTNARRPQEVTLINITSVFPVRFVGVVSFLRISYLRRIREGGPRAYLELHSEGYGGRMADGQELPDLFPESYKPADLRPLVMLAEAMGIIQKDQDTITGHDKVYLVTKDSHGLPNMQELGDNMQQIIDTADVAVFEVLQAAVESHLEKDYKHVAKRQDLVDALLKKMEELAKSHRANDPVYISAREGFSKATEILSLEAQRVGA